MANWDVEYRHVFTSLEDSKHGKLTLAVTSWVKSDVQLDGSHILHLRLNTWEKHPYININVRVTFYLLIYRFQLHGVKS